MSIRHCARRCRPCPQPRPPDVLPKAFGLDRSEIYARATELESQMNRFEAEKRGRRGEAIAAWFLRLQGWRIVGERIKTPRGEVDLIARRGRTVGVRGSKGTPQFARS